MWFNFLLQRMDLGECPKIHDLALRADYELASKTKDYFYDIDVSMNHLFNYVVYHGFSENYFLEIS